MSNRPSRIVYVTRRLEMFVGQRAAKAVVLLPDGSAEPVPEELVGASDAALAAHYGVDEVVHPPESVGDDYRPSDRR